MSVTIKDVARESGVCIATVSRVFNAPEKVVPQKRELILSTAKKLGYKPNALARGLVQKTTRTVGIIVPDIQNLFYPLVVKGLEDSFSTNQYLSFICNTYNDIEKEKKYVNKLLEQRVDGIIFVGTRPIQEELNAHILDLAQRINIVLVFDSLPGTDICSVYTDETEGAFKAVKYLYHQGHNRIAFFTASEPYTTYHYKLKGYQNALSSLGIAFDPNLVFEDAPYADGGYNSMQRMVQKFGRNNMPSAVFTISDQMAGGVLRYAYEKNLKIPEDLRLIGFSGSDIAYQENSTLSTVNQMPYQVGSIAAGVMMKLIRKEDLIQKKIIIEPKMVIRDT